MVVLYKHSELFEDGKIKGEIFTEYPEGDLTEPFCIVATMKKDEIEIDSGTTRYEGVNFGLIFSNDLVDCLEDIFNFWLKHKKSMAGWIFRASCHSGKLGCDYVKPGSDDWIFIEEKRIRQKDIKKISKKENIGGFCKIQEEYINDELTSESFELIDGTVVKMERDEIGFRKEDRGLILRDYELEVFNELIDMWKIRKKSYNK